MGVWLRYLAIVVLVGAGFNAFWGLIALGGMVRLGSFDGAGFVALNLGLSIAAIALAVAVAAPGRRGAGLGMKLLAVPSVLGGGLGVVSAVLALFVWVQAGQSINPFTDSRIAEDVLLRKTAVESAFFSACTLVLAVLVLVSRRRVA